MNEENEFLVREVLWNPFVCSNVRSRGRVESDICYCGGKTLSGSFGEVPTVK